MLNLNQFYTYVYLDPRKSGDFTYQRGIDEVYCFNHEPFYIGKGCGGRIDEHLRCQGSDKNRHKKNTIKKIQKVGLKPIIIKVLQNVNEDEALAEEIKLICLVGRADKHLGSLTNMTDGGEGSSGSVKKKLNLIGQKFNRWSVISYDGLSKHGKSLWLCRCDCGNQKIVSGNTLKQQTSKSCGCLCKESAMKTHTRVITINNKLKTLKEWSNISSTSYNTITSRLHRGWSPKEAVFGKK